MYDCSIDRSKIKIINIDFGRVGAGKIVKKNVKFLNEGCKKQCYQVHRDQKTNKIDNAFKFEFYKWTLLAGGSLDCKIEYRPTIPNSHYNADYFDITDCDGICYKIFVQGTCIGPSVVPSTSRLFMVCPKNEREIKKRLQLRNDSEIAAIFMFDIDQTQTQEPFKLDITRGTIASNNHIYVTITFSPRQQGLHAYYLPCLVHHQDPIVMELYGYRGSAFSKPDEFVPLIFNDPEPLIRNFEGYMSDAVKILWGRYPPISLSENYLDFGQVQFIRRKSCQCLSQNISLTNHTNTDFFFKWDEDPEGVFDIKPRSVNISGQKSAFFDVYFIPNKPDSLFSKELSAHAFWKENTVTDSISKYASGIPAPIPLVVSIRMIGQSFSSESIGWIPQYEIPQTVILPPCLPPFPVYTTFLIKLRGHLPITFRFIPPSKTNFALKPMVGIIHREYQIVTVRMFPKIESELLYTERWAVQFNGNSKNEISIEFKAYAEYPKIDINNENLIEFPSVYPQCEEVVQVIVRNPTRHCIRYSFLDLPSDINVEKSDGIIRANEILIHDWIFSPKEIGDYNYTIYSSLVILKNDLPVGTSINVPFHVTGRVQHGYLVGLPEELNFGTVLYGETKKLHLYAFNFSSVKIHWKLICKHRGWPLGDITRDVKILPVIETIHPESKKKIDIYLTPREPGFYQLILRYSLRSNSLAKDVLSSIEQRDICQLNCMCVLPGFEIKDLVYFSGKENISKVLLWKLLEIDKFNITTSSVLPNNKKIINLRFPELVLSEDPLLVKLLIFNSSPAQSIWSIKRVKKCDCKQVVKSRGLTFKYKEYCCDHRLACDISPNKGNLQPREQCIVTIKVCYVVPGKTYLQWELKLSDNRKVIINAEIVALSDIEMRPSLLAKDTLTMEKSYIGDMRAMNQMCWMYNSTDYEVEYSLDTSPLLQINSRDISETFSCRNPKGIVPRKSYYPIIFKFQPRRFESYQITLPIKLGDTWTKLSIEAETDISSKTKSFASKVPLFDEFSIPELPVYFSIDHIVVSAMPMHSRVKRMMMIFNESKNQVIGYQWRSYNMPQFLQIEVHPIKGRIQPMKAQSFCIEIRSLSHPCKMTATLCCQFLNLSAQRTYEKSIITYNSLCEELKEQFIITEKGITEPKPWLKPNVKKPQPFYKSLSISCYIYSSTDTDLKATVDEQLKSSPPEEICVEKNTSCNITDKKFINIAIFVMEGMIWDILNSNVFMNTVKENLVKKPNVKYGQYAISSMQRHNLQDRSYNIPPKKFLESIFEEMILGIVHEEFGLSMSHFSSPQDIRQFSYEKRDPRSCQQSRIFKSTLQGSINQLEIENEAKVELKEVYLESQVRFDVEDDDSSFESNN